MIFTKGGKYFIIVLEANKSKPPIDQELTPEKYAEIKDDEEKMLKYA